MTLLHRVVPKEGKNRWQSLTVPTSPVLHVSYAAVGGILSGLVTVGTEFPNVRNARALAYSLNADDSRDG